MIRKTVSTLLQWRVRDLLPLVLTIRIVGLGLAALALWAFLQIADKVLQEQSHAIDKAILLALFKLHTPLLNQVMLGLTFLGEPTVLFVISLLGGIWLLIQSRRSEATILAIAAAGAALLNYLLKELFARARPVLWERIVDVGHYSFPSGHAMLSLVVYGIIAYLLLNHFPRWQLLIISLTWLLITGIGLSRLYLGVHWPTDVAAGYAAGSVWLIACIFSLEIHRYYRSLQGTKKDNSLLAQ